MNQFKMASCQNVCGNFTCVCKNTADKLVDLYDPEKCYKSKLSLISRYLMLFFVYIYIEKKIKEIKREITLCTSIFREICI